MIKASKRSQGISYAIREVVIPARKLEDKGIKIKVNSMSYIFGMIFA